MTDVVVPDPALVVLVGSAGSGKSTFAARQFAGDEILSSDAFRAAIAGDASDQSANAATFKALHRSLTRRLAQGRLTVVDATNLTSKARRALLAIAHAAGVPAVAMVLDVPPEIALARNAGRPGRVVPDAVVRRHLDQVRRVVDGHELDDEGFDRIVILREPDAIATTEIRRIPTT